MNNSSTCPTLDAPSTAKGAVIWLRHVTKWIGPGFHPDTPATDYIRLDNAIPLLTPIQAERLDRDLARCFRLLEGNGRTPYDVSIKVQRRLLGIRWEPR